MERCWKGALLGGSVGAVEGLLLAPEKYPDAWMMFDQSQFRICVLIGTLSALWGILGYWLGTLPPSEPQ